ncbi:MAG: restriction endonuclease subunit S [Candidatus Sericytochromatia bacterium]
MDLEVLAKNFDLILDAPNSVPKLREYILQLAVQGKLVPQDPNDEPASELLKKIKAEKDKLIAEGKIKKEKPLEPIKADDIPFEIPKSWVFSRLGEILSLKSGSSLEEGFESSFGLIPYVKVGDMNLKGNEYEITTSTNFLNLSNKIENLLIPENSIIFPKRGGAIATNKKRIIKSRILADSNIMAIIVNKAINLKYIFNWFLTIDLWSLNTGTSVPQINNKDIYPIILSIPPLEEQKRIVARVEQLMKYCDELEEKQKEVQEKRINFNLSATHHLTNSDNKEDFNKYLQLINDNFDFLYDEPKNVKQLRETILQLAVQGKLVPQNPNDEPASELLKKIKAEKDKLIKEGKIKKEKPLEAIKEEDIPFDIPNNWEWIRLASISKVIEYGTSEKSSELNIGIPVLRMGNIFEGNIIYSNLKYVSLNIKDLPRLFLKKNDILFNRTNSYELVGKTAVYYDEDDKYTLASYIIRISILYELVSPKYLNSYTNSIIFRKTQIEPEIVQQCGQANFNGTKLSNVLIPLPPLEEQKRIVARVEQLMKYCDELEANIEKSNKDRQALMDSVLSSSLKSKTKELSIV